MARRVLLHIGTPKTATTYLQEILFQNRPVLEEHGVHYPSEEFNSHFRAALDLLQRPWGGLEKAAVGEWDGLAERVRALPGTVVVSNEILAGATPAQAQRAVESLGGDNVDLVITARDLVRQIPAEWQENVKHRSTRTFAQFVTEIRAGDNSTADLFWGVQHLPDILDRWSVVPPDRVTVVTVPQPGADPTLLWSRLSAAFGLDGIPLDLEVDRANTSLGVPETALLRRINERVAGRAPEETVRYRYLVREVLAHRNLSLRTDTPRLALPESLAPWADGLSQEWIDKLTASGYRVAGDLGELRGTVRPGQRDPDEQDLEAIVDAGVVAIYALLLEAAEHLATLEETRAELARARHSPLRHAAVRGLGRSSAGRGALAVYRRARGRSSREA